MDNLLPPLKGCPWCKGTGFKYVQISEDEVDKDMCHCLEREEEDEETS